MRIKTLDDLLEPSRPKTLAEWEEMREKMYENIKFATSIELLKHDAPLNPHIEFVEEFDEFAIEKAIIQVLPGLYLAGNIYRPKDLTKKYPAILNPHGHFRHGRVDMDIRGRLPLRYINLAIRGFVVFAYDMISYGDTKQIIHNTYNPEHDKYNFSRFSIHLNNGVKALDFVSSLPYVDADRIGCTGCSGGATQTYFLSAYDKRIKASAPINMASIKMQGGCNCENAPFLRNDYSNLDYTMLSAPRPLFMAASDGDWTVNSEEIEFPAMKHIYSLYGKEENFECFYRIAPHSYEKCTRERAYAFFCKAFGVENKYEKEINFDSDIIERLVLSGSLTFGGIPDFGNNIKTEQELTATVKGIIEANLAKLSDEEKKKMAEKVFALDHEFYFDIPYIKGFYTIKGEKNPDKINPNPSETYIKLGNCPANTETMDVRYYYGYNYADDTKRVNNLIKLFREYPKAIYRATKKTAALCEIAQRVTGKVNLIAVDPDYSDIVIPGIELLK